MSDQLVMYVETNGERFVFRYHDTLRSRRFVCQQAEAFANCPDINFDESDAEYVCEQVMAEWKTTTVGKFTTALNSFIDWLGKSKKPKSK